jgi:hypothetical protein
VWLAPGIVPRAISDLARVATKALPNVVIPSLAPRAIRAHARGTPLSAYRALWESVAAVRAKGFAGPDAPTLIWIDPRDELVSARGLREVRARYGKRDWEIREARAQGEARYRHLVVNEYGLGAAEWRRVREESLAWLGLGHSPES